MNRTNFNINSAQHHRHGDVEASPFGSWEIPSSKRALHSLHVLPLYPAARLNPSLDK